MITHTTGRPIFKKSTILSCPQTLKTAGVPRSSSVS